MYMTDKNVISYKTNDHIIDYGEVYIITRIKSAAGSIDKKDDVVYYQNYYTSRNRQRQYCTIPYSQLVLSRCRKPITRKEAKKILNSLSQSSTIETSIDPDMEPEDVLKQNNIYQTSSLIKKYWMFKHLSESGLSPTQVDLYQSSLSQVTEEMAFVLSLDFTSARKKILKALRE